MKQSPSHRTRARGFSLIELLIVVAIIGVVAAIAVPNLLNSKHAAYNSSAIGALKAIHTAEISYRSASPQFGSLAQLDTAGLLNDPALKTGNRSSYTFVINPATLGPDNFEVTAAPVVAPWRYYYMDASGVIRSKMGGAADANSPPIKY